MEAEETMIVIGSFEVVSGKLMVSDPCYKRGTRLHGTIDNVKNGKWRATIVSEPGSRYIASLLVEHTSIAGEVYSMWSTQTDFNVGVDSGQAGFFDDAHYKNDSDVSEYQWVNADRKICEDDPWYSMCCDATCYHENNARVIPFGAVSMSGYGDGLYHCHYYKNEQGEVVAAEITFIREEEDDDYGYDEEDEE